LEWETKVEHVFACNEYNEEQKMRLVAAEFSNYALTWWNKYQMERIRNEEPIVDSWIEIKRIMRKRYILASYKRDLQLKLQALTQGNRNCSLLLHLFMLKFHFKPCDCYSWHQFLIAWWLKNLELENEW